jgi:hypothetical protein
VELTRRQLLAGAGATTLAAVGIYELAERAGRAPSRPVVAARPPEQHVLGGLRVVTDNNVEVVVPPLHHEMVTFRLPGGGPADLRDAQRRLDQALAGLDRDYASTPAGLGMTVGWGMPYFRGPLAAPARDHVPVDRRASQAAGHPVSVLLDAIRFPSDTSGMLLEQNDAVLLLRSDNPAHIHDAHERLVRNLDVWQPTSIRRGFVGGGFDGGEGLPHKLAVAAGVPGAELIPEQAELFLGFTSTQKASLGPQRIANIETLGYAPPPCSAPPGTCPKGRSPSARPRTTCRPWARSARMPRGTRASATARPSSRPRGWRRTWLGATAQPM